MDNRTFHSVEKCFELNNFELVPYNSLQKMILIILSLEGAVGVCHIIKILKKSIFISQAWLQSVVYHNYGRNILWADEFMDL